MVGDTYVPGVSDPPTVVELYDPSLGTWSVTASPIEIRFFSTSTLLLDARVLVTGLSTTGAGGTLPALAELYDPSTGD